MTHKKAVRAIIRKENMLLTIKRNKFGMQYYTLIGGGVNIGENTEIALRRELREEASMEVGGIRLVFIEDGGDMYGVQYVYLCDYIGGEPKLTPNSEEALISAAGKNLYEPVWLPISELSNVTFRSSSVRDAVLEGFRSGFPENPQTLVWKA